MTEILTEDAPADNNTGLGHGRQLFASIRPSVLHPRQDDLKTLSDHSTL